MFKVFFNSEEFARRSRLEDVLAIALWLHRDSNVKHEISVIEPYSDKPSITLVKDLPETSFGDV